LAVGFTGFEPALSAPPHMGPYSGKAHCQRLVFPWLFANAFSFERMRYTPPPPPPHYFEIKKYFTSL